MAISSTSSGSESGLSDHEKYGSGTNSSTECSRVGIRSSRGVAFGVEYYPIRQRWRRIRPHLENPELQRILVRDMRKVSPRFRPGMKPAELDGCDWRFCDSEGNLRRGRPAAFWDYAIHASCHWIVNFASASPSWSSLAGHGGS